MKMKSIPYQILERVRGHPKGWVFSATDFLNLGRRNAVDQALCRLERRGEIRRVARGVYERSRHHQKLGTLSPKVEEVARAVARRAGVELQVSGATAANQLGLSEQVVAKPVYLTPGSAETIRIGNQTIEFRHVRNRWFVLPGTHAGNVFQAILYLGKGSVSPEIVRKLRSQLGEKEKAALEKALPAAPTWAHPTLRAVSATEALRAAA